MRKIWIIGLLFCLACSKDNVELIPNVRFNAEIDLDAPQYIGKNPFIVKPGGFNRVVGVQGVVVWRVSSYQYNAFDLMCTHQHKSPGFFYTEMAENNGYMICPECGSQFEIISEYGSVVEGPAQRPLKKYQTSVNGSILRIWN